MNQALMTLPFMGVVVYNFFGLWGVLCLLIGVLFGFIEKTPIGMMIRAIGYKRIASMISNTIKHTIKIKLLRLKQYMVGSVKIRGEYYDITYIANNHSYIYPIRRSIKLGTPSNIFMVLDEDGSEITDKVYQYLGPNKDAYITPAMIGLEKVFVHYNDATEKEIARTDRIA